MHMITKTELLEFRQRLDASLQDLAAQNLTTANDRAVVELDQQSVGRLSRMDALQQQAMAKATHIRRGVEMQRARAALVRMDTGEFGFCTECAEQIAPARLNHDPSLPWCLDCAKSR